MNNYLIKNKMEKIKRRTFIHQVKVQVQIKKNINNNKNKIKRIYRITLYLHTCNCSYNSSVKH